MKRLLLGACALTLVLITACKKEEVAPTPTPTPTPENPGSTGFTPPTTNYWKIDTVATNGSADAFTAGVKGSAADVSKPFSSPIDGYCNISLNAASESVDIRSQIAEGGYKEFNISTKRELGASPSGDSIAINITVNDQSGSDNGYYYYVAKGGKLYISKLNGKLRYTTKGVINMTGVKNTNISDFAYSTKIDFSWSE